MTAGLWQGYPRTKIHEQGEGSQFASPFAKSGMVRANRFNASLAATSHPRTEIINKTRNDIHDLGLFLLSCILLPVASSRTSCCKTEAGSEKKEEHKSPYTTSSNVVLSPSFALYYSTVPSLVSALFSFCFLSTFIPSLVLSFFTFSFSPSIFVTLYSSPENKKCMLNLCGFRDKFAYQILGIRNRGIEQAAQPR